MKLYINIFKPSQPTITKTVDELSDFMWQEGWRTLNVIGYYPGVEQDLEDSQEYFTNLQYPSNNFSFKKGK